MDFRLNVSFLRKAVAACLVSLVDNNKHNQDIVSMLKSCWMRGGMEGGEGGGDGRGDGGEREGT